MTAPTSIQIDALVKSNQELTKAVLAQVNLLQEIKEQIEPAKAELMPKINELMPKVKKILDSPMLKMITG